MESLLFSQARWLRSEIADPTKENACMATLKEELKRKAPSDEKVRASLLDLVVSSDEATYLLRRIAEHMQSRTREVSLNEATVEHIFPINPSPDWTDQEKETLEPYLWHIGNLTMLGYRLNSNRAKNRGFDYKKTVYGSMSELEISQLIAGRYARWDEEAIKDRAANLASDVLEIWDFDNPSRV
jgi:hypothetical protein